MAGHDYSYNYACVHDIYLSAAWRRPGGNLVTAGPKLHFPERKIGELAPTQPAHW